MRGQHIDMPSSAAGRRQSLRRWAAGLLLLAAGALAPAGSAAAQADIGRLDIVVTYAGATLLSPEARLIVELYDETRTGGSRTPVLQRSYAMEDPIPITVAVPYYTRDIDPDRRYAVSVHVEDHGRRRFHTPAPVPVLTRGAPTVLTLILVAAQ